MVNLVNCESIRRITTWRHVRRCCHGMTKIDRNEIEPDRSHEIVERLLILPKIIHRSKFTWEQTLKGGDNTWRGFSFPGRWCPRAKELVSGPPTRIGPYRWGRIGRARVQCAQHISCWTVVNLQLENIIRAKSSPLYEREFSCCFHFQACGSKPKAGALHTASANK